VYALGERRVTEVCVYRQAKCLKQQRTYVVGQLSSGTRHHVLAVAALDKSLSMVDDLTYQRLTAVLLLIYGSLFLSGIYYCLHVFWCAATRMPELELEQRTNIKFLVKLGKSGNERGEMQVQVYGDNAMKKTAVCRWVKRFAEGRESVTDEEKSGRPATSRTEENIANIRQIVCENRRLTVRSTAEQVNIDRETVRKILTEDLDMRKVCAKMVPKELTEEQKQRRSQFAKTIWRAKMTFWAVSSQVMKHGSTNTTLKRTAKAHNGRPKKFRPSKSRVKTMLLTFFDIRGIVRYEFVPTGQTVNQVYYLKVLERLREKVTRKRPKILPTTHGSYTTTMHLLTRHCL